MKKAIAIFAACLLNLAIFALLIPTKSADTDTPSATESVKPAPVRGDYNGDGKLDKADVETLRDIAAIGEYSEYHDFNGDGDVDILDVVVLQDYILEINKGELP